MQGLHCNPVWQRNNLFIFLPALFSISFLLSPLLHCTGSISRLRHHLYNCIRIALPAILWFAQNLYFLTFSYILLEDHI